MSYQSDREEFIGRVAIALADKASAYYAAGVARRLMRHASTLQRLAVAQCNGDWPADNGERKTQECPLCGSNWAPSAITGGKLAREAHAASDGVLNAEYETAEKLIEYRNAKACPDCRTTAALVAIVREELPMYQVIVNGDPRGYVVKLAPAQATREDIDCGRAPTIGVPAREY